MMNTPTLSKDIISHSVERPNPTAILQPEILDRSNGSIDPNTARLQPHPTSLNFTQVGKSFLRAELQSEREYSNYLLELLTDILTGFADKFIISKKTTILLSVSLASFLAQPDVRSSYSIAKYRTSHRREWKDRLSIVDFIDFLNNERINCNSALECGELSKLISCFKVFLLNDIVSSMLTPMRIDLR